RQRRGGGDASCFGIRVNRSHGEGRERQQADRGQRQRLHDFEEREAFLAGRSHRRALHSTRTRPPELTASLFSPPPPFCSVIVPYVSAVPLGKKVTTSSPSKMTPGFS